MSDFSFSATAECDMCGSYLSGSDDECDHNGQPVKTYVFREMGGGRDSLIGVECAVGYKWDKLEETVGDAWISYEWLGSRETVNALLSTGRQIEDLRAQGMALHAPNDIGDSDDE